MANGFTVSSLTDNPKELLRPIWTGTVNYSDTIAAAAGGAISLFTNVKGSSLKMPRLSQVVNYKDADCAFSASGGTTITQATMTLNDSEYNDLWCVRDLENKFTNGYLPAGQRYENLGALQGEIVMEIEKGVANKNEDYIWTGDNSNAGQWDGYNTLLSDAIGAATVTATGVGAITESNAYDSVKALVKAAMADKYLGTLANRGGLSLWLGHDAMYNYDLDYQATVGTTIHAQDFKPGFVQGTRIQFRPVAGLTGTSYMYLVPDGNLAVGTDLLADTADLKFGLDQYEKNVWATLMFKMGCQFLDVTKGKYHVLAT